MIFKWGIISLEIGTTLMKSIQRTFFDRYRSFRMLIIRIGYTSSGNNPIVLMTIGL